MCVSPQTTSLKKADHDQLATACAQVLQMSSSDWIAKIVNADASSADAKLRGIASYDRCYDSRTDRLAASLAKTGKGPLTGARDDFRDFEAAITDFTTKALAPNPDPVKEAYAALYEKQFRYAFYQSYASKSTSAPGTAKKALALSASAPKTAPPAPISPPPVASNAQPGEEPKDVDEMTLAKNRFGELLRPMPDDRLHEIHEAFGEILGMHHADPATQLAVYCYAIFVLEPSSEAPFSPPPF
jgi:hypothetical protein